MDIKLLKAFSVHKSSYDPGELDGPGEMESWPSVTGVMDLYCDVIFPNAFKNAIAGFLQKGFIPTDHQWSWEKLVAYPIAMEERGNKLWCRSKFHSTQHAQDARTLCRERMQAGLDVGESVGFTMSESAYMYFDDGPALLAFAKKYKQDMSLFDTKGISAHKGPCQAIITIDELWEWSLTPVPANQEAMAIAVKSMGNVHLSAREVRDGHTDGARSVQGANGMKTRSVCGARGLKLAPKDTVWSASKAIERIKELCGAKDEPNVAFAKAFIIKDGPDDEFGSFKFPFTDVENGELVAVPKAIESAAGALDGARAGVTLSDKDREGAKRFCETYYAKMAQEFGDDELKAPWEKSAQSTSSETATMWKGQYLGNYVEHRMCMAAINAAHYSLMGELSDCMMGYGDYKGMTTPEKLTAMSAMHDEHKDLCMSVLNSVLTGVGDESVEDAAKSLQRSLVAIASIGEPGSGLPFAKHAETTVNVAKAMVMRAVERAEQRLKGGRELSSANRESLSQVKQELEGCIKQLDELLTKTEPTATEMLQHAEIEELRLKSMRLTAQNLVERAHQALQVAVAA